MFSSPPVSLVFIKVPVGLMKGRTQIVKKYRIYSPIPANFFEYLIYFWITKV